MSGSTLSVYVKRKSRSDADDEYDDDGCSCASMSSYNTVAEDIDLYPFFVLDPAWLRSEGNVFGTNVSI